ncbi:DUF3887 domain-containing protein [Ruminococcaceae bacterium OttesenSCG-928-D13]|nr:DUF3887 domain-containing protein [Ruminococcaceae bacterium OttesenSCG-928-D13]
MKKILSLGLVLLTALALLAGCQGRLPEGVDKDRLETDAKAIVDAVNAGDYQTVHDMFGSENNLPVEEWEARLTTVAQQLGSFEEYKSTSYLTTDDKTHGELVTMLLESQYANGKVVWQVTFTTEYEILKLWVNNA